MTVHMTSETENVARVLAAATGRHFGAPALIERLSRQSGGASRQTWSFDALVGDERHALILRRDPPTLGKTDRERAVAIDRATEFRVLQAAHAAGVKSPEPLFELTAGDSLGEAYVMRRIGGIAIARKLLRDAPYETARSRIAGQLGEILARIHATDPATLPVLPRREATDHIVELRRSLDALGQPQPVFELALTWLDRRKPAPLDRPVLVHGDYRTGNYLVDETGVTTILDWELAHLGDPLEDLGWLCVKSWRFGAVDKPAGGFGSREELWAAYERAGGGKVDPVRAHWWEVFGTVHWGIICLNQAWKHLSGSIRSMEHASIGRRAVETEVDLLQLLKQGA
jgi:aminoglycoside phosphotransferase (APT) family kinase protein